MRPLQNLTGEFYLVGRSANLSLKYRLLSPTRTRVVRPGTRAHQPSVKRRTLTAISAFLRETLTTQLDWDMPGVYIYIYTSGQLATKDFCFIYIVFQDVPSIYIYVFLFNHWYMHKPTPGRCRPRSTDLFFTIKISLFGPHPVSSTTTKHF